MQPAALPPPTASIPAPNASPLVTAPRIMQPATTPRLGSNPWKPTVPSRDWQYLVIHHTATGAGSVESINASHLKNKDKNGNPWLGIGYHFVIGNGDGMADGAIEPTFRWRSQIQGAHAGSSNKDYNERGIGICLVGNFEKSPPTPAQKRSIKLLVQTLKSDYRISSANIVGHKDIRASATECPGKFFPMAEIAGGDSGTILGLDADGVPLERVASNTGSSLR
jgi:N-acetylmuramoyl-L-alanine amidase